MRADSQKGLALIEAAIWLVVTLPLALGIVSLLGEMYDQNIMSKIPANVLRESYVEGMRYQTEGADGLVAQYADLSRVVSEMAEKGVLEGSRTAFHAINISAKACYAVYRVDPSSGMLSGAVQDGCDLRGPLAGRLALNIHHVNGSSRRWGIPLFHNGATSGYFDRIVVVGVVIGGEVPNLLTPSTPRLFEFSALSVPRQEITL